MIEHNAPSASPQSSPGTQTSPQLSPQLSPQTGTQTSPQPGAIEGLLRCFVVGLSLLLVCLFLYTAARRMRYPFDLEWIESGILVSVDRITHGLPLYAEPSLHYIPYLYAPLYFFVCAAVAKFTGVSFFTLRLVSTLSALATLVLLFVFVRKETRKGLAGSAAVGLFAAMYPVSGAWFDIGRVDSLFLFLFLLALFCTRYAHPVVAAVVWVLAFQTKQSALPIAIPFLLTYWDRARVHRVILALGSYLMLAGGSILYLNHLTHGWYSFYIFGAVAGLPGVTRLLALYVPEVLLAPVGLALVMIAAAALLAPVRWRTPRNVFYLLGSLLLYPAFWYVHWHRGVGNTMLAIYLWTALLFGLAVARLLRLAKEWDRAVQRPALRLAGSVIDPATTLVLLAILAQLGAAIYGPGQYVPSPVTLQARKAFEQQVRTLPGEVYVLNHSFDDLSAAKQTFAEGEAIGAVVDAKGPWRDRTVDEVRQAFAAHRWSAIALDDAPSTYAKWFTPEDIAEYPVHVPAAGSDAPRFLTSQPQVLLLPCSSLTSGLAARLSPSGVAPSVPACNADSPPH